jgi:hypothetical protein
VERSFRGLRESASNFSAFVLEVIDCSIVAVAIVVAVAVAVAAAVVVVEIV